MKNVGVSIITAGFRRKFLEETYRSIIKQTYKNWEWILLNDGSQEILDWKNKHEEELKNYNFVFVDISKNRGRFGLPSRNAGVMLSDPSYPYWVWLDDDVSFQNDDYLEEMVKVAEDTGLIAFSKLHLIG
jgi:glycosyltransferase involved in cell wall biosynthesis